MDLESPLLSTRTETGGTSETRRTMLPSPPPLDPDETKWINQVNKSRKGMPSDKQQYWNNPSIYRVPASIANVNPKAYQPQVVSFGPYHHGKRRLRQMEEHKHRVLLHFLERSNKPLDLFLYSLRKVAEKLEESYETLDSKWTEHGGGRFLELMIMDGCFMLEIMRTATTEKHDYAANDPIFNIDRLRYIKPYIMRDMLMLENQLPMLVLYVLLAVEKENRLSPDVREDDESVNMLILKFCSLGTRSPRMDNCLHVMDVYRKGLLTENDQGQHEPENGWLKATEETEKLLGSAIKETICVIQKTEEEETEHIIRSATELHDTGIQFEKSQTRSLKGISFSRGILKLPVIEVNDNTKSMFLNLMTFERLHIGAGTDITAYVTFLDNIINDKQDVALLHAHGIIQNAVGSDEAAVMLINSLCKEVPLASNRNLEMVQKEISEYCEKSWNRHRAHLNRTYFRSPWTIVSLVAAILLFGLTIIQTVYTLLS